MRAKSRPNCVLLSTHDLEKDIVWVTGTAALSGSLPGRVPDTRRSFAIMDVMLGCSPQPDRQPGRVPDIALSQYNAHGQHSVTHLVDNQYVSVGLFEPWMPFVHQCRQQ